MADGRQELGVHFPKDKASFVMYTSSTSSEEVESTKLQKSVSFTVKIGTLTRADA